MPVHKILADIAQRVQRVHVGKVIDAADIPQTEDGLQVVRYRGFQFHKPKPMCKT